MNFVNSLNLFGVKAKEIPCIIGSGKPSLTTAGAVGCLYMDVTTGDVYKCTSITKNGYVWEDFIGNFKTAKIGWVTLLANAWVGENSLYRQVVEIEGVTENSQVDLTPNVEQLLIFYEKDLTFTTKNESGVVTVYAIGQKPTNDYTIQVTITEVEV